MAPTAHVIVYYVRTDGEVIADSLDVELAGILQNFVSCRGILLSTCTDNEYRTEYRHIAITHNVDNSHVDNSHLQVNITVTPGEVAPGESVNLVVSAKPNSFVALLGVDQRSLLLKSGNDISYVRSYVLKIFGLFNYHPLTSISVCRNKYTRSCNRTIGQRYRRTRIPFSIVLFGDPVQGQRMTCFK